MAAESNARPLFNKGNFEMDDAKQPKDIKKVRGKPFKKGESGNLGGKLPGTRNAATLMAEALLDGLGRLWLWLPGLRLP